MECAVTSKHAVKDASQVRLLTSAAMIPAKAVKAGAPCRAAVVGIASPALVQRRPEPGRPSLSGEARWCAQLKFCSRNLDSLTAGRLPV